MSLLFELHLLQTRIYETFRLSVNRDMQANDGRGPPTVSFGSVVNSFSYHNDLPPSDVGDRKATDERREMTKSEAPTGPRYRQHKSERTKWAYREALRNLESFLATERHEVAAILLTLGAVVFW